MARTKGSKNKTTEDKVQDMIDEVKELPISTQDKAEIIDELDDLLGPKSETSKEHTLVGYHPITGEEIWK